MSNHKGWPAVKYGGYTILPWSKGFDLCVDYMDDIFGPSTIELDALEVYENLKKYFKDTKYE